MVAAPDWSQLGYLVVGWPFREDVWRNNGCAAQDCILNVLMAFLKHTQHMVFVIASDDNDCVARNAIEKVLSMPFSGLDLDRVMLMRIPVDDCWMRDTGPVLLEGGSQERGRAVCFQFNAWGGENGGCYTNFEKDRGVAKTLCTTFSLETLHNNVVLEGGSVCSDGEGTLLTTEECLLNPNRNPQLSKKQIEAVLASSLGALKVIWLECGAAFDSDTSGHVDNMAVFCGPAKVMLLWAEDSVCSEQHHRSAKALETLSSCRDARGRKLEVFKISMSSVIRRSGLEARGVDNSGSDAKRRPPGESICASYVNVVIAEQTVFAPAFGDTYADERAKQDLAAAFKWSGKNVVMVPARELILGGGGLHCLTIGIPSSPCDSQKIVNVSSVSKEL